MAQMQSFVDQYRGFYPSLSIDQPKSRFARFDILNYYYTVSKGRVDLEIIDQNNLLETGKYIWNRTGSKEITINPREDISKITENSLIFAFKYIAPIDIQCIDNQGFIIEERTIKEMGGEPLLNAIINVTREQVGTLKMFIKDNDGNPISGTAVRSTSQPSGQSSLSGTTGSDGSIAFGDVKLGSYTFEVSRSGYIAKSGTINAKPGETSELTITLEKEEKGGGGIPGFPYESILLGLALGVLILWIFQRRQ